MKRIVSICLMMTLVLSMMTKVVILVDFVLNQEYIARVLCVNKDVPKSTCNGKCHLSKELNLTESKGADDAPISNTIQSELIFVFYQDTSLVAVDNLMVVQQANPFFKRGFYTSLWMEKIYHPPEVSLG